MPEIKLIDFDIMKALFGQVMDNYNQGLITKGDVISEMGTVFWNALTELNESIR